MTKVRRLLLIFGLSTTVMIGTWLALGPRVMASVSRATYHEEHYRYHVTLDEVYDSETNSLAQTGIVVSIDPARPADDASGFAPAYMQAAEERVNQWAVTRPDMEPADVMILFARPLTLEEANAVLSRFGATVFESGVVGYAHDVPFAEYSIEAGPLLAKPLAEFAETNTGFMPEVAGPEIPGGENGRAQSDVAAVEIRGYMAVRAWVPVQHLADLSRTAEVRFVDTTPQEVRDLLATDWHWKDMPITALSIEMPVWAYDW